MLKLIALVSLATIPPSFAADKVLNGGDACERRFHEVREDLRSWIENGGAEGLEFPAGQSAATYRPAMLTAIRKAVVSCANDQLLVGEANKVCVNSVGPDSVPFIRCQREAFLRLSQDEQYRLTHHEYAGVAGFETNQKEQSSYYLSNQISGHLDATMYKRLAVKTKKTHDESLDRHFGDFYGDYDVVTCAFHGVNQRPEEYGAPDLCKVAKLKIDRPAKNSARPSVNLKFLVKKEPVLGSGISLAWPFCQLGYGTSHCLPVNTQSKTMYLTTRLERVGNSTYLDFTAEDAGGESPEILRWSMVLKRVSEASAK